MAVVIDVPIRTRDRYNCYATDNVVPQQTDNKDFLNTVLDNPQRLHYNSRTALYTVGRMTGAPTASLGIQAIHQAFAEHLPLSLRPETLWYFIIHEVAEFVRQNSDKCAPLFTTTPEARPTIEVRDDSLHYTAPSDWLGCIDLFRAPLRERLSDRTMELFLPSFSTSTPETETALLVAMMDAASPYYDYLVRTLCGIPQIRLEGTANDWQTVYTQTDRLAIEFNDLRAYFADLLPVLQIIAETADRGDDAYDEHFWRSIYKYNSGSGTPRANGWITAFFAHLSTEDGPVLKEEFDWRGGRGTILSGFPSHVSKVPFTWDYLGTHYAMVFAAGVTGVDYDDSFLSPGLGFAVAEV